MVLCYYYLKVCAIEHILLCLLYLHNQAIGLVNKVVEPNKLDKETEKWAKETSNLSPYTLELGKKA